MVVIILIIGAFPSRDTRRETSWDPQYSEGVSGPASPAMTKKCLVRCCAVLRWKPSKRPSSLSTLASSGMVSTKLYVRRRRASILPTVLKNNSITITTSPMRFYHVCLDEWISFPCVLCLPSRRSFLLTVMYRHIGTSIFTQSGAAARKYQRNINAGQVMHEKRCLQHPGDKTFTSPIPKGYYIFSLKTTMGGGVEGKCQIW